MGRKRKNWATDTKIQAYVEDFDLSFYATSIHQLSLLDQLIDNLLDMAIREKEGAGLREMVVAIKDGMVARETVRQSIVNVRQVDLLTLNRKLWETMPPERQKVIKVYAGSIARKLYPIPQKCSSPDCNNTGERHHPDYLQPDKIIWLCSKHHNEEHKNANI